MKHSFFTSNIDHSAALIGSYDLFLVVLSYLVAVIAGFCALSLINFIKVSNANRGSLKLVGGVILGLGVWSMHFTGMLAFSLPVEVSYLVDTTLISILPAILASVIVLHNLTVEKVSNINIVVTALVLALGIAAMHFVGMMAMSMKAHMVHDFFFTLIAVVLSWLLAGLTILVQLERIKMLTFGQKYRSIVGAGCFGFAVATMHYLAMATTYFYADTSMVVSGVSDNILTYGLLISSVVLMTAFMVVLSYKSKVNLLVKIASTNHKRMVETIDNMQDCFVLTNASGEVLFINSQFSEVFGEFSSSFTGVGDDINQLYQELAVNYFKLSSSNVCEEQLLVCKEQGQSLESIKLQSNDQKWWLLRRNSTPTQAVIHTWTDISSQVAQERELVLAKEMALETLQNLENTQSELVEAKKMASLGGVVSGVAHELNTPLGVGITSLSSIKLAVESIQRAAEDGSLSKVDLDSSLDNIYQFEGLAMDSLKRVASLIQQFKLISVDGGVELPRQFKLRNLLLDNAKVWRTELPNADVEIDLQVSEDITMFTCDTSLLQVLKSLFKNSIEHAFNAKNSAEQADNLSAKIVINAQVSGENVHITYQDNGKGVEPSMKQKLFEPFVTTSRSEGQIGLGLYIAYNLVAHKLKGVITLAEKANEPLTTFEINLPVNLKKLS